MKKVKGKDHTLDIASLSEISINNLRIRKAKTLHIGLYK